MSTEDLKGAIQFYSKSRDKTAQNFVKVAKQFFALITDLETKKAEMIKHKKIVSME